jgi:hypothetical protein
MTLGELLQQLDDESIVARLSRFHRLDQQIACVIPSSH